MNKVTVYFSLAFIHIVAIYSRVVAVPFSTSVCVLRIKPQMPEVFHICFVGMNKTTVYFSLAFIHIVRTCVVALSLHLSRGRLCLRVHCLIDGIMCVFWTEHKPNASGTS